MKKYIKRFIEMSAKDIQAAGGKAANLGELTQAGFNVPPGSCVTSNAFFYHLCANNVQNKIDHIVSHFDFEDYSAIEKKTAEIRKLIESAIIPGDLDDELRVTIKYLTRDEQDFVAVRSSVAVKDSPISSFPGMMDTYHYLRENEEILFYIKKCWASLWTTRATFNRHHKNVAHQAGLIAPIIQKMVTPETAGILFTANPITNCREEMVIEANWGLGESVVSGKSMNDFYAVNKSTLEISQRNVVKKTVMVSFDEEKGAGRREGAVAAEKMGVPTLSDEQLHELGQIGIEIERVFNFPQDIEWAYQNGELFILQSRNIPALND